MSTFDVSASIPSHHWHTFDPTSTNAPPRMAFPTGGGTPEDPDKRQAVSGVDIAQSQHQVNPRITWTMNITPTSFYPAFDYNKDLRHKWFVFARREPPQSAPSSNRMMHDPYASRNTIVRAPHVLNLSFIQDATNCASVDAIPKPEQIAALWAPAGFVSTEQTEFKDARSARQLLVDTKHINWEKNYWHPDVQGQDRVWFVAKWSPVKSSMAYKALTNGSEQHVYPTAGSHAFTHCTQILPVVTRDNYIPDDAISTWETKPDGTKEYVRGYAWCVGRVCKGSDESGDGSGRYQKSTKEYYNRTDLEFANNCINVDFLHKSKLIWLAFSLA